MIHNHFSIQSKKIKTHVSPRVTTRGHAWTNGKFYTADGLAELALMQKNHNDFLNFIKNLNGCYSIVLETDNHVFLASDKFATYPLFYAKKDDNIYISDSVSYIAKLTGITDINENAVKDLTYTGYILKDETLLSDIFQVIASEYITIQKDNLKIKREAHYRFNYEKKRIIDGKSAISEFDSICKKTAEKLVASLNGRKCVVFLSGGADSRFCAYLLKLAGYEDKTLLITYGTKLSPDYMPATKTAAALGMKHMLIPYRRKHWRNTYKDNDSLSYIKYAQNLSITAHLREHFVVRELLDKGIITTEDIIIPGHLGTVAGRQYKAEEFKNIDSTHKRLIDKTTFLYNMNRFADGNEYIYTEPALFSLIQVLKLIPDTILVFIIMLLFAHIL